MINFIQKTIKLINQMHYSRDSARTKMVFLPLVLSYVTLVISATDKVHCETYFLMAKCEAAHEGNFQISISREKDV